MSHLKWKLGIASVVFAGAVVFLALAGMEKGFAYTVGVDEFAAKSMQYQGKRMRICGIVGAEVRQGSAGAEFAMQGKAQHVSVSYRGIVPDGLKEGAEVIVEGKADGLGRFQADTLMTKCASKYDEMPASHPRTGVDHGGTQPGAAP
jgi:cytochrome c-type biogenesis protein CcmE